MDSSQQQQQQPWKNQQARQKRAPGKAPALRQRRAGLPAAAGEEPAGAPKARARKHHTWYSKPQRRSALARTGHNTKRKNSPPRFGVAVKFSGSPSLVDGRWRGQSGGWARSLGRRRARLSVQSHVRRGGSLAPLRRPWPARPPLHPPASSFLAPLVHARHRRLNRRARFAALPAKNPAISSCGRA